MAPVSSMAPSSGPGPMPPSSGPGQMINMGPGPTGAPRDMPPGMRPPEGWRQPGLFALSFLLDFRPILLL